VTAAAAPILEVRNLTVSVPLGDGRRADVVSDVSFTIEEGGTLGLVGESGSGKTMTSLAVVGLLPPAARVESGEILFAGENLLEKSPRAMQRVRGKQMAMVLQDPMTALDPSFTVRSQLSEPLREHRSLRGRQLEAALVSSLEQVHLPTAGERLKQYPHQLSGGMRQRVVSAIALAGRPRLLIADEPTTALDATTQARFLGLLKELQESTGFAFLLITHDLHIVRHLCREVVVMYSSQIVEHGRVDEVFSAPQHPYTEALLQSVPMLGGEIRLEAVEGQAPDIAEHIVGCRFAPRCRYSRPVCFTAVPAATRRGPSTVARCFGTAADGWLET
jgi:oligopeptide/dipeptide ABC transporter ATP-binding protein